MNTFKTNSRFASLLSSNENNNEPVKKDIRNDNISRRENYDRSTHYDRPSHYDRSTRFKDNNIQVKTNKTFNALAPENFPELSAPHSQIVTSDLNYSEKLKMEAIKDIKKTDDLDYELLNPGWIYIKKDSTTGKKIIKSKEFWKPRSKEKEEIMPNEIFNEVVDTYYTREDEYIQTWGIEEWEKLFKFENYDYHYFDKLDELYYKELEDSEVSDSNDDMIGADDDHLFVDRYYD